LFDYVLMRSFGAAGIATAPAASGAVSLTVLFVLLRRTMRRLQRASASSF
jgi:peptidoglycan biosynthesis protein MviN/MurJ (putative lipid II flippase)